mgnify:CR=1 FL=1
MHLTNDGRKKPYKIVNRNYWNYILGNIHEDTKGNPIKTEQEKTEYIFNRFYSEYDFEIKRFGKVQAMINWLQGLALDIEYMNGAIYQLAQEMGSIDFNPEPSDKEFYKIVDNYWNYMALVILKKEPHNYYVKGNAIEFTK